MTIALNPAVKCVACGTVQAAATALDPGTTPGVGDILICAECEAVLCVTETGTKLQPVEELCAEDRYRIAAALHGIALVKRGFFDVPFSSQGGGS